MLVTLLFGCFLSFLWVENVLAIRISDIQGLSLLNISLYLLLMNWAFKAIKRQRIFETGPLNIPLLLLVVVVAASVPIKFMLNEIKQLTLLNEIIALKSWVNPILLFFILYNVLDDSKTCKKILLLLVIFLIVTLISVHLEVLGLIHIGKLKVVQGARSAGFVEPNQYAAYLVLFIPLILSCVLYFKSIMGKVFFLFLLLYSFMGLLITGSRGGAIAFLSAMGAYLFFGWRYRALKPVVILAGLFLLITSPIIIYVVAPVNVKQTIKERFVWDDKKTASEITSGRTILWENGLKLFLQSPIYGHGHLTFTHLMKQNFRIWGNSHNDYLLYLVEHGLTGFLVFIMVFGVLFKQATRLVANASSAFDKLLHLAYLAGLSGYLIAMFGVNIMQPRFFLWAYSAAVFKYALLTGENGSNA